MAINTQKSNDFKKLEMCQDPRKGLRQEDKHPKGRWPQRDSGLEGVFQKKAVLSLCGPFI